eukprot:symbB.v1.2.011013.t1/scaffold687.1/size172701/19
MAPKTAAKAEAKPKAKADAKAKGKAKAKKEEVPAEEEKSKVPQPDRTEYDAKVQKIQDEIDKLTKKQKEMSEKIQQRSSGKEEFYAKKAELRTQLDEITAKMDELQAKKEDIEKAVGSKREEGREMRSQLNTMKKSIGYNTEQEIDNRIASIEFQLCTESVPLKEEKKLLAEIQALKKNRSKVNQVQQMEQSLTNFDPGLSMKEQKQAIQQEMQSFREEKKKIQEGSANIFLFCSSWMSWLILHDIARWQEKMTALQEERKEKLGDMSDILEKRDSIGKQIQEKIKERNEFREEFRQKEREYNAYQAELKKARQEKILAEKAERQKEIDLRRKQRKAEELDTQPYISEITLIEQTILFCKNLVQTKSEDKKDEKKEIAHNNKEGEEVLLRKEDREEEFYFAPTKGKKNKKNKSSDSAPAAKPIKHNAATFSLFKSLELDAPLSTDEVPALLEKLEGLLEDYKVKVKEWEETREEQKRRILEGLEEIEEKKAARAAEEEAEAEAEAEEKEEDKEEEKEEKEEAKEEE